MNIHLFHQMTLNQEESFRIVILMPTHLAEEIGTADFDTLAQQLYGIQGGEDANQKHQFFLKIP